MEKKPEDLLIEIDHLINEGMYDKASKIVEIMKESTDLDQNELNRCNIYNAILKTKLGKYVKSLEQISIIQSEQKAFLLNNQFLSIDLSIAQAEALWRLEKYDEAIDIVLKTEKAFPTDFVSMNSNQILKWALLLNLKGSLYSDKGDYNKAMEYYIDSMRVREEHGNSKNISISYNNVGTVYWYKGDHDKALDYFNRSLSIRRELGDEKGIAGSLNNIGSIHQQIGELDKALEHYKQSKSLFEKLGNNTNTAITLMNTGNIYRQKGDLNKSINYYQESLAVFKETDNKLGISMCLNNIGEVYRQKGELDQAISFYNDSLLLFEDLGNEQNIAMNLSNIGEIYSQKGDLESAITHLTNSLGIFRKIGNDNHTASTLYAIISMLLEKEDITTAKNYLDELETIDENSENKTINLKKTIAEALLLKISSRTKNRGKAEVILTDIVRSEEIIDFEMSIVAMLNLCDLLLSDLKMSGDIEILKEVNDLVFQLRDIASNQHSFSLMVETYLLQSRLALLEKNIDQAKHTLLRGQLLAEEKGLQLLAMKLSSDHDLLLEQEKQWERVDHQGASFEKRMELARIEELVSNMIQKRVVDLDVIPEEKPEMILLLSKSGISLFSSFFLSEREINDQLISGFISAINTFSSHIFERSIDRIKIGEYTVLVRAIDTLLTCYIFKGQSYTASLRLEAFSSYLQNNELFDKLQHGVRTGMKLNSVDQSSLKKLVNETFLSDLSDK